MNMHTLILKSEYFRLLDDARSWRAHEAGQVDATVYLLLALFVAIAGVIVFVLFLRQAESKNKFLEAENRKLNAYIDTMERVELSASADRDTYRKVDEVHGFDIVEQIYHREATNYPTVYNRYQCNVCTGSCILGIAAPTAKPNFCPYGLLAIGRQVKWETVDCPTSAEKEIDSRVVFEAHGGGG